MKKHTKLVSSINAGRRYGKIRLLYLIMALIAVTMLNGCGENQTAASSSAVSSEETVSNSSASDETSPVTSTFTGYPSSSSSDSFSGSSEQSGSDYALPVDSNSSQSVFEESDSASVSPSDNSEAENDDDNVSDTSGSKISQKEYDSIKEGMTYAQVKSIIGSEGKLCNTFGGKGSVLYTEQYKWEGNGTSDSYASLIFKNGALDSKIEFGLN